MTASPRSAAVDVPLVVDLDGTLVTVDTLHESLGRLLLRRPWLLPSALGWLLRGKAAFKREVARRMPTDASLLPYHEGLLTRLRDEARQRALVLCTASDVSVAAEVAAHLGVFATILGSEGRENLSGEAKAQRLVERYGAQGFDYAGNSTADLPVFAAARRAWIVAPTAGLQRRKARVTNVEATFEAPAGAARAVWQALRPLQWAKNILVFVPLLTAVGIDHVHMLGRSAVAFVAFCALASTVYLLNDTVDLQADRAHPRKRKRPIASGALPVSGALLLAGGLLAGGLTLAFALGLPFGVVGTGYVLLTSSYSMGLKRVPILDSVVLALLYTLRIIGGAAAILVLPSFWLLAFSVFLFMSLALGKRHTELVEMADGTGRQRIPGREYRPEDLETLVAQGNAAGYASVVVLALYMNGGLHSDQYQYPELLALICVILLYWISKFWLNAQRREIEEDPVVWALTNRVSRGLAVIAVLLFALARWLPRSLLDGLLR